MTLEEFIKDLKEYVKENPQDANKKLFFATSPGSSLVEYLSIYTSDDNKNIYIDVGE